MEVGDVEKSASAFLAGVLASYHKRNPKKLLVGLACECDPGAASLYVFVCESGHDVHGFPCDWAHQFIEQGAGVKPPKWFDEYDDLQTKYFQDGSIEYAEIERALAIILAGIAKALVDLERNGTLSECGFLDSPRLCVFTEDDADQEVGDHRVDHERLGE